MVMSDVPNGRAIAKCYFVEIDDKYTVNQRICVIKPRQIDDKLLFYKLNRNPFYLAFDDGVKQTNLRKEDVLSCPVGFPKKRREQRAIATALSDVDALLDGLDRLIAKKRDIKQAAMQQLLTGKTRLPGFEGAWRMKPLAHAGRCLRGVSYDGDTDLLPYESGRTIRLLRANNVQNASVVVTDLQFVKSLRASSQQVLCQNDVVVCMANGSKALVGKAGAFKIDDGFAYTFGAFMGCFRTEPALADPRFVYFIFQTGKYRDYINLFLAGSSINNLRPSSIESMEFAFPPLDEQTAIADVLTDMDAEIEALEKRRNKTADLKQAMMRELLTGRTRLLKPEALDDTSC